MIRSPYESARSWLRSRQQRPPILIEATNRRKDVFVEKPMAVVLDHANEAVRPVPHHPCAAGVRVT
jgi:hypothetical protein